MKSIMAEIDSNFTGVAFLGVYNRLVSHCRPRMTFSAVGSTCVALYGIPDVSVYLSGLTQWFCLHI